MTNCIHFFNKFKNFSIMKKLMLVALAILATQFYLSAQQTETTKEKKEKKNKGNYNNNWNNWGGGERIQGEGPSVTENRDIRDFKGFKSGISADITLKQSTGGYKVTVQGQKNIIALVKMEIVDGNLRIGFEKGYSVNYKEPLKITLEAPSFEYLGMSGSGNVKTDGGLSGIKATIAISGSGDFDLNNLKFETLNVGISGSGNVDLDGTVGSVELGVSGSGDVKAENLKTQSARCRVSGSGNITLNVQKELDASVSGSGDIRYYGKPASVRTHVTGSGDIVSK